MSKWKEIKLKRSEKRAIRLGLLVIGLVIVLNVAVFPFYDHVAALHQEKQQLITDLKSILARLKEARTLDGDIQKFQGQIKRYRGEALAGESEQLAQVALEELVTNLAKEQGLQVTNTYKEKADKDRFGYMSVSARVTVQGDYEKIIRFLEAVQNAPRMIAVTDLNLKHYRGYSATVTVMGLAKKE